MKTKLNAREQKVLWATIDYYIAKAEPVGSKALLEGYNFDISSATIRNVMSMLDRSGLLYQPHTSAGRVPSDSGYRVYVDELINPSSELTDNAAQMLQSKMGLSGNNSLEQILRGVAQILATLSGCIALITAPDMQTVKIRHLQLVMVDTCKVMVVAVSDAYHTASVMMDLPSETDAELLEAELQILNNFLNAHLRDKRWSDLTSTLQWHELDSKFQQYATLLQQSLHQLMRIYNPVAVGHFFISGMTELLRQPEFTQLSQIQSVIQLLEADQASLLPLIFDRPESAQPNSVTVKIGSEISLEPIKHCTLISTTYSCDRTPVGSVGVLGPTRLDYERAIASVQAVATHLSELIGQW
ncbi:heat-inducible transcriptional repressor HrcA [Tumidithrix helvetica PCC 7403]|uniref:heat-inducible transcriptional repressor HrcA n=1 Tax=Tumidithrix helvetica TaxID=3457545 RepID=UPI003C85EB93